MPVWIVALVLFIVGWAFALVDTGWRNPVLWVLSSIAAYFILSGFNP